MIEGSISAQRVDAIAFDTAHDIVDELSALMAKVGGEPIVDDAREIIVGIIHRRIHCALLDIIEDGAASGD